MRALIVAYYFPPKGGAGTQRFAKFCKYLPDHGVEPVVVSVAEAERSEHAPDDDPTLAHGGCRVERVAAPVRAPLSMRLRRKLRLHIDEDEWAAAAGARALELAREERFDVVVTTLSPYACYRVGERLQRELGIPWVADLRDPWALDGWRVYPSGVHARRDLMHMQRTLRGADYVVANVPEARRAFLDSGAAPGRCVVVPNGYDEDDFDGVEVARTTPEEPLRLVHIGTFHPADLPRGLTRNRLRRVRNRQIEPLGRTGHFLLRGIAMWRDKVGDEAARRLLHLHLYGRSDASHRQLAEQLDIAHLITDHGYVPHRESVRALLSSDVVFVPLHGVPDGERALVVPGKLYEAIASERAVLAALPPGDGADLVDALDVGVVAPPTDAGAIAMAIQLLTAAHARDERAEGCARERFTRFSRRALTERFAHVLEAAVGRAPSLQLPDLWAFDPVGGS
ncbi:MAG: glycosyltransferase [Planctomycetes bacterium]|nr:glycosyltransferase [Planctomycetota bacterium]